MNEELYNKISNEKNSLEKFLRKVKFHKNHVDFNFLVDKLERDDQWSIVRGLEDKKKTLETKSYNAANRFSGLRLLLLASIYAILYCGTLIFLAYNAPNVFSSNITAAIMAISLLGGSIITVVANEKIKAKLLKKHTNKLENSDEYKELINQLTQERANLEKLEQKIEIKEKILKWYTNVEMDLISRRDSRKCFLNYLENQTTPKTTTIDKSKNRVFKKVNKQNDALLDS